MAKPLRKSQLDEQAETPGREAAPRGSRTLDASVIKGGENVANLDRLIHERMRLGIVSALAANTSLTFNELKGLLDTTDGNLSVHARKLEDAGYIACSKSFEGRMPRTDYALTASGRAALEKYLNHMEALIGAMRDHGQKH